ncbi:MAG: redoxin domain-containing protein [Paludibacteraceae bacterium]|nr:redoxin domain-containing protein [Paludibacteraceae bacterium]
MRIYLILNLFQDLNLQFTLILRINDEKQLVKNNCSNLFQIKEKQKVYGISKDSPASHQRFIAKYELPFPLLSYPSTELLQALGAYGEKKMYGKTVMGTLRKTFVFNQDGTLERIIEKVDTKNHTSQIL